MQTVAKTTAASLIRLTILARKPRVTLITSPSRASCCCRMQLQRLILSSPHCALHLRDSAMRDAIHRRKCENPIMREPLLQFALFGISLSASHSRHPRSCSGYVYHMFSCSTQVSMLFRVKSRRTHKFLYFTPFFDDNHPETRVHSTLREKNER